MTFKRNITITIACIITECLLSLIPTIFMIYIFFLPDRISEIFSTLFIVPYFIFIANIALIIISLVAKVFINTKFYIKKETFVVKKNDYVMEIRYTEIAGLTYDFGDLSKFNARPSRLVLFDENYKPLISINNPSIIMVQKLKNKCKHVTPSYDHNKRFLYLFAGINGICLVLSILAKIVF